MGNNKPLKNKIKLVYSKQVCSLCLLLFIIIFYIFFKFSLTDYVYRFSNLYISTTDNGPPNQPPTPNQNSSNLHLYQQNYQNYAPHSSSYSNDAAVSKIEKYACVLTFLL